MPEVTLREVTPENLQAVLALKAAEFQQPFVASNARSLEQARSHAEAWLRAIYAGDLPVGLLMMHDESLSPNPRQPGYYFFWRLMIDASQQGRGLGRSALRLLVAHVRTRPDAHELLTSCRRGAGSPEGFYLKLGFEPTGQEVDGEVELRLRL